jgi:hypothetical protein
MNYLNLSWWSYLLFLLVENPKIHKAEGCIVDGGKIEESIRLYPVILLL